MRNLNTKYGYNDLQRRQNDLCLFLQTTPSCSGGGGTLSKTALFSLMKNISFIPLPLHSH